MNVFEFNKALFEVEKHLKSKGEEFCNYKFSPSEISFSTEIDFYGEQLTLTFCPDLNFDNKMIYLYVVTQEQCDEEKEVVLQFHISNIVESFFEVYQWAEMIDLKLEGEVYFYTKNNMKNFNFAEPKDRNFLISNSSKSDKILDLLKNKEMKNFDFNGLKSFQYRPVFSSNKDFNDSILKSEISLESKINFVDFPLTCDFDVSKGSLLFYGGTIQNNTSIDPSSFRKNDYKGHLIKEVSNSNDLKEFHLNVKTIKTKILHLNEFFKEKSGISHDKFNLNFGQFGETICIKNPNENFSAITQKLFSEDFSFLSLDEQIYKYKELLEIELSFKSDIYFFYKKIKEILISSKASEFISFDKESSFDNLLKKRYMKFYLSFENLNIKKSFTISLPFLDEQYKCLLSGDYDNIDSIIQIAEKSDKKFIQCKLKDCPSELEESLNQISSKKRLLELLNLKK